MKFEPCLELRLKLRLEPGQQLKNDFPHFLNLALLFCKEGENNLKSDK